MDMREPPRSGYETSVVLSLVANYSCRRPDGRRVSGTSSIMATLATKVATTEPEPEPLHLLFTFYFDSDN